MSAAIAILDRGHGRPRQGREAEDGSRTAMQDWIDEINRRGSRPPIHVRPEGG